MTFDVPLPELGDDSVQEVLTSAWLAVVGKPVGKDDDLLEITTDKAAFCVPCPRAGVLVKTCVEAGDTIHVGDIICVLEV